MIIRNNKTTSVLYKGTKEIVKRYKGTLVVYEAFKKLIASGVPPITLQKCKGVDLADYKIYGNSVQEGEPTPDNSIEVESVGVRTKNLANVNAMADMNNCTVSTQGDVVEYFFDELENGKMYTVYFKYDKDIPTNGSIGIYNNNKVIANFANKEGVFGFTANNVKIRCYIPNPNGGVRTFQAFPQTLKIMIEEGSYVAGMPTYEPYGYKVPITVSTNEIINDYPYTIVPNPNSSFYGVLIQLKPNTNYVIGCLYNSRQYNVALTVNDLYNGRNITEQIWLSHYSVESNNLIPEQNKTFTTSDSGIVYICSVYFRSNNNTQSFFKNAFDNSLFIREADKEPITTNIYLNEPLRAIGDYKDYIDFENGKLVRNVGESQMLSSYLYSKSGAFSGACIGFLVNNTSPFGKAKTGLPANIVNGFNSIGIVARNAGWYNANKPNVVAWMPNNVGNAVSFFAIPVSFLTDNGYTDDLTGVKAWVDAQNAISPIMITHILETPTEEDIELPNIPTLKGTTIIEVDTNILPSNMEVEYYGKE